MGRKRDRVDFPVTGDQEISLMVNSLVLSLHNRAVTGVKQSVCGCANMPVPK